jgi:hypothetical protein
MALSDPRSIFGIHSVTFYNKTTRLPYGMLRVLQGSTFALSGDLVGLNGGSSRYPWNVEDGYINAELSLSFNEYPDFLYTLFLGKAPTANSAETTGDVSTITNVNGTSVVDATTGIASVAATSADESDLKFGKVLVKAVTTTTVDLYYSSDIDLTRGTDITPENDLLKITSSPITIPGTGGTVADASSGLEFTGGSGSIGMTADDTAIFEVRPINTASSDVTIGAANDSYPEFGAYVYAQQSGTGQMYELDIFRLRALGMPHNFNAKEFSVADVTAQAYYDSSRSGIFSMRVVTPS